jgi:hypothetical protein
MSYHITVKNNYPVTYKQILESSRLPKGVVVAFEINIELAIEGYSRFYLTDKSARGVALTVSKKEYDVELNIGSSKDDYILATNISVALAEYNGSMISPESDDECSIDEFLMKYDENWADTIKTLGINAVKTLVKQNGTMKLPCCVRPFYFGPNMLDSLSMNPDSDESFASNFIESIRHLQFIENRIPGLEIPTLMEGDFPEGVKQVLIILPEFKLLIQKCDYVILQTEKSILRVEFDRFIKFTTNKLQRVDEEQYVLNPISKDEFIKLIAQINVPKEVMTASTSDANNGGGNWWKFWKK